VILKVCDFPDSIRSITVFKTVIPEPIRQHQGVRGPFTSLTKKYKIYVCACMCFVDVDRHRQIDKGLAKLEQNSEVNHTGLQARTSL